MRNFIVIFLFCWLFFSCKENDIAKINAIIKDTEVGLEKADSVHLIYKEDAYTKATIYGKEVIRYFKNQNKLEFTKGIEVMFYDGNQLNSVLTADYAIYNDIERTILVKGSVEMYNYKHELLRTQELTWDMNTKQIIAKGKLTIKTPYDVIYGVGMTAREDFTQYAIHKVTGVVAYSEDDNFR